MSDIIATLPQKMRVLESLLGTRWTYERNIEEAALLMVAPHALSKKNRYRSSRGLFVQNQSVSITIHRSPSTPQAASDRIIDGRFESNPAQMTVTLPHPTASVAIGESHLAAEGLMHRAIEIPDAPHGFTRSNGRE